MAGLANHRPIETVQRASLNPKNSRKRSESFVEGLARSPDRFGFIDPIEKPAAGAGLDVRTNRLLATNAAKRFGNARK